eukprot:jgi/Bigna1/88821/estExt_fgenesh1_pg.C_380157
MSNMISFSSSSSFFFNSGVYMPDLPGLIIILSIHFTNAGLYSNEFKKLQKHDLRYFSVPAPSLFSNLATTRRNRTIRKSFERIGWALWNDLQLPVRQENRKKKKEVISLYDDENGVKKQQQFYINHKKEGLLQPPPLKCSNRMEAVARERITENEQPEEDEDGKLEPLEVTYIRYFDSESGCEYFLNYKTQETQWEAPEVGNVVLTDAEFFHLEPNQSLSALHRRSNSDILRAKRPPNLQIQRLESRGARKFFENETSPGPPITPEEFEKAKNGERNENDDTVLI